MGGFNSEKTNKKAALSSDDNLSSFSLMVTFLFAVFFPKTGDATAENSSKTD